MIHTGPEKIFHVVILQNVPLVRDKTLLVCCKGICLLQHLLETNDFFV